MGPRIKIMLSPNLMLIAAGLGMTLVSSAARAQSPIVHTQQGYVQGIAPDANGIVSFKGIAYATPPVGALRWKPPQAAPAFSGVKSATQFGNVCISSDPASPDPSDSTYPQSEDCLTLNVWTPAPNIAAGLPVMVWIHGGGFQFSSSANPTYDGSLLATQNVVVVSMNYRLGVFGFLATPQLDGESGSSGAWGLQDQIAALKWVRSNIKQFGGDPSRVTIFGESAGAHSVGILLASPAARGTFNGAIIESGAYWDTDHGSIDSHPEALAKGAALAAKFPGQDLRTIPATVLNAATPYNNLSDPSVTNFAPSIDGQVLKSAPGSVFVQGKEINVPVLGGWNAAEYSAFPAQALLATPASAFYAAAATYFGQEALPTFMSLYPAENVATAEPSSLLLDGDMMIAEQTWSALSLHAQNHPAYAYHFTYTSPFSPIAGHTDEVPFVFGTMTSATDPSAPVSPADLQISRTMMSYWTNFARSGNPNGPGLPAWPAFQGGGSEVMILSNDPAAAPNPDFLRFQFIDGYRHKGVLPLAWRPLGNGY